MTTTTRRRAMRRPISGMLATTALVVVANGCGATEEQEELQDGDAVTNCVRQEANGDLTVVEDRYCGETEVNSYQGGGFYPYWLFWGHSSVYTQGTVIPASTVRSVQSSGGGLVSATDTPAMTTAKKTAINKGLTTTGVTAGPRPASPPKVTASGKPGGIGASGGAGSNSGSGRSTGS